MSEEIIVRRKIFREYIGSNSVMRNSGGFPVEIINGEIPEFHFILASVKEYCNPETERGNGIFQETWNVEIFDVERLINLKREKPDVKVVISIGGRGSHYPAFDPEDTVMWIENAKNSLENIILNHYGHVIDGIDIAYERIVSDEFADCMGQVIEHLKRRINGFVVSIAPSKLVQRYYENLYQDRQSDICWVNFQFYYEQLPTVDDFSNRYNDLVNVFTAAKLLAGFSTDPTDRGNISLQVFCQACTHLIRTGSLPGIFVWDADHSNNNYDNHLPRFFVETKLQRIILDEESE